MGVYVDEGLLAGNKAFQELTEKTLSTFESQQLEWDKFEFLGALSRTLNREYSALTNVNK